MEKPEEQPQKEKAQPKAEAKGITWERLQPLVHILGRVVESAPRVQEMLVTIMKSIAALLAILVMLGLAKEMFLGDHTEILPFVNATGDEEYDGKALADCLVIEYEGIRQTHSAQEAGVMKEKLRVGLRPTEVDSLELEQSLGKVPEVGMAGIRVQVGELLLVIKRLFRGSGTTTSGSIQKYGSTVRIVARRVKNGKLEHEWVVTKEKMESKEEILDLVKDLAFQMAWKLNKEEVGAESWEAFKDFTEGLESYREYRVTKNPAHAEDAIEEYRAVLSKQPTYPIVHYNLGIVYSNLDQLDEALQEYEEAAEENPNLIAAFYNAGVMYLKRGKGIDPKPEDYDEAINWFGEVITKTANLDNEYQQYRAKAYGGRAWAYIHKYDEDKDTTLLDQAMADSKKALELDRDLAQALGAKGRVLDLQAEDDEAAIEQYTKAIAKDDSYNEIYYFRGYLYDRMGQKEAARSDLTWYLEVVPNAPDRQAIEDQLQLLGEKPTAVPATVTPQDYYEPALADFELGEYDSALKGFTQVISMTIDQPEEKEYADAYYKRGSIYQAQKDAEAAVKDYNRYLELVPDAPEKEQLEEYIATMTAPPVPSTADDYCTRGIQRLDEEEYELALEDLNQALALDPDLAEAYYARGKAHRLLDHAEAATSDFREYLNRAPDDAPDRTQVEEWIEELARGSF